MPTSITNNNIPFSQQEALAIGYAQYALMHTLTQQFRVNYPAALLHAAAASGYLPLPNPMMAAAAAAVAAAASANTSNTNKSSMPEKFRDRRKSQKQESDNNNNHIQSNSSINDQPYRRETYQTLLESSRLLGQNQQQQKLLKPVPIDLRKNNGLNGTMNGSKLEFLYFHVSSYYFNLFCFKVLLYQIIVIHHLHLQYHHQIHLYLQVHPNPYLLIQIMILFAYQKS